MSNMPKSTLILRTSLFASLVFATLASVAHAQADPNLGRAALMQAEAANKAAHASLINSAAVYEKAQAEIARLYQDTYEKAVNNDLLEAEVYYKKRAAYHAYHAAQRVKPDVPTRHMTQARTASTGGVSTGGASPMAGSAAQPYALSAQGIRWPTLFNTSNYASVRYQIDNLLKNRTPENSGAGSQNCAEIVSRLAALKRTLRENIRNYHSLDYLTARNFVEAVEDEAQKPLAPQPKETLDKVAGN